MPKRESHLGAARKHGRKAIAELRHMTADSALYWVLSHRRRVAEFRRSVKGTRAAKPLEQLLAMIREEASPLPRSISRKRKPARATARARRRRKTPLQRFIAPPFMIG